VQAASAATSDVRSGRAGPPPCPTDCCGLLQMLGSHTMSLMMLFGPRGDHLAQASATCFCLLGQVAKFQTMTKEQAGHLSWSAFIDACCLFLAPHDLMDNPPMSRLDWFVSAMNWGSLPTALGTPLLLMFGSTTPRNPLLAPGNQKEVEVAGPHVKIAAATAAAINCTVTFNAHSAPAGKAHTQHRTKEATTQDCARSQSSTGSSQGPQSPTAPTAFGGEVR
jgi:hypothetical protein